MGLNQIILFLCVFSVFGNKLEQYCQLECPNGYHTVCSRIYENCGPAPRCGPNFKVIKLTEAHRRYILDIHNYYRNWVATGNETFGYQPPAADMMAMNYNRELEFVAQCWANACNGNPLVHDECRRTEKHDFIGQNLGYLNSSHPIEDNYKIVRDLIDLWYNEVKDFRSEWIPYTQDRQPLVVGHYTQMLWASTSELGCALVTYTSPNRHPNGYWHEYLFVCNYGPSGNFLGAPLYSIGRPQSQCPKNSPPNPRYRGLCGQICGVTQCKKRIGLPDY